MNEAGLREMVKPALLAVISPVAVGLTFRFIGHLRNRPLLGAEVLARVDYSTGRKSRHATE